MRRLLRRLLSLRSLQRAFGRVGDLMTRPPGADDLRAAVADRVVVITGASRGIGAQVARDCGAAGAHVVLVARSADDLAAVAADVAAAGGRTSVYATDLSDADAVTALAEQVLADHDRVDVLVNNAGRSIRRTALETAARPGDLDRVFALNFFAAARLTLALLPSMVERGSGHVVQVSTQGTVAHVPRFSTYLASKAALEEFSRSLAGEVRHRGIAVSNVHLPLVRTDMIAPTPAYDGLPIVHSVQQASNVVTRVLVTRAPQVSLGYHHVIGPVDAVAPRVVRWFQSRLYRLGL